MESSSHKRSLLDVHEDANISTFRRRNKIIILVLVFLMILLILSLAALIINLVRLQNASFPPLDDKIRPYFNPALEAFCHVNSDAPACLSFLNPIISRKFVSNPNQIFALSLQAAAEDLQRSIASILTDAAKPNCSNSLRDGLDRIREQLAALRVNPFVESRSDEQRGEMMERIVAVEEDVEACGPELVRAKAYLNGAGDFLIGYAEALQMFEADNGAQWRGIFMDHVFIICMCTVPQFVFIIGLFCSLFRIRSRR